MEPISPKHITVTDPFWAPRIRTVADRCTKEQLHRQLSKGRSCHCRSKSRWPSTHLPHGQMVL